MVSLVATLTIKEGKMEEAIQIIKEIVPKVRSSESGCKAYIPHTVKGRKNKQKIIFYEKYEDKTALDQHTANLPKNFEKLFPLLEGGFDLKTCEEII
ncbi:MAG: antibiotic biosynthesis monooxygenase [Candidatus Helarchaeota archaeon]|nr:antibiotic biosynthesis monooxygenase [Candidatus Helarchaeota archaeon]